MVQPSPILTAFIYLAWTGTDNQLNVSTSSDGATWTKLPATGQSSYFGPTLAVSPEGFLYLGWTGTDLKLNSLPWDGVKKQWGKTTTSGETSTKAYCLIVHA